MKKVSRILSFFMAAAILLTMVEGVLSVTADESNLVISDCDTTDGWKKTGGNGVSVSQNGCGTSTAIHRQVNYGAFRSLTFNLPGVLDVSNYSRVEWDAMFYSQKQNGASGTMWEQIVNKYVMVDNALYLKLISEGGGYRVYRFSKLTTEISRINTNWVHFSANIADFNTENGTFDPSKLTGFYFSTTDGATDTTIDNGFIRLDNIKATGYTESKKTPISITECEDTSGWNYSGNAAINISKAGKTGNSIILEGGNGILRRLTYTVPAPINATGYKAIEWDMTALAVGTLIDQFKTIAKGYTDTIGIEISDGVKTAVFDLMKLEIVRTDANWWHFAVCLENADIDHSNIVSFTIYTKADGAGNTSIKNTIYKLDNICVTDSNVNPNGYDYATIKETVISDAESLSGWSYSNSANMTLNVNGYTGSAINVFAGYCKVGPLKYTLSTSMNINRHERLSWNIRFLNGTELPDMWNDVAASYANYIKATVADVNGNAHSYSLSDIKIEKTSKEGWYTMTVDLKKATGVDFTSFSSFTFQTTDGNYADTSLRNCNMRLDNLTILPAITLEKGDVNGDGVVNIMDLIRFKHHEANDNVEFYDEAADINGDSKINSQDLVALRKLLLGIEVETAQYAPLNNNGWSQIVKP